MAGLISDAKKLTNKAKANTALNDLLIDEKNVVEGIFTVATRMDHTATSARHFALHEFEEDQQEDVQDLLTTFYAVDGVMAAALTDFANAREANRQGLKHLRSKIAHLQEVTKRRNKLEEKLRKLEANQKTSEAEEVKLNLDAAEKEYETCTSSIDEERRSIIKEHYEDLAEAYQTLGQQIAAVSHYFQKTLDMIPPKAKEDMTTDYYKGRPATALLVKNAAEARMGAETQKLDGTFDIPADVKEAMDKEPTPEERREAQEKARQEAEAAAQAAKEARAQQPMAQRISGSIEKIFGGGKAKKAAGEEGTSPEGEGTATTPGEEKASPDTDKKKSGGGFHMPKFMQNLTGKKAAPAEGAAEGAATTTAAKTEAPAEQTEAAAKEVKEAAEEAKETVKAEAEGKNIPASA
eukprot:Clim_evm3s85 gene=Clim_evmTU3s85